MELKLNRVVWAVDVFEPEENKAKVLRLLKSFTTKTNSQVEIVHILNYAYVPPYPSNIPSWGEALQVLADKKINELADSSEIPNIKTKVLLVPDASSTRKNVDMLLEYVKDIKADAILVATHARSGVPRLVLGSFAETLLLKSQVPVLTVNPDADITEKISHILFPTYFTPHSHNAFITVLTLAKRLGAQLTLYYKEPLIQSGSYAMPLGLYAYMESEIETRRQISSKWREQGEALGVSTTVELDETPGRAALAISEYATDKGVDLIAMVTRSDLMSAILLGSATRQVVRHAQCPVFVLRESL